MAESRNRSGDEMDDLIKITGYDLLVMEEVSQDSVDDDMPIREHVFVGNDYL